MSAMTNNQLFFDPYDVKNSKNPIMKSYGYSTLISVDMFEKINLLDYALINFKFLAKYFQRMFSLPTVCPFVGIY